MTHATKFQTFRTALLTAVMAMLMGVISLPVSAEDSKILKKDELKNLISNAKTAQDHQRIADHYAAKAEQFEAEATEHAEEAAKYKANPNMHEMKHPGSPQTASHCESMARSLRDAAKQARQLAEDHQAMAKSVK
ncbi:MAG TPA: hypothetical protein VEV41_22540 [Terriglobales bacterium]|nr:hypothetical protein [Terriglobales bacterium]